jgi:hypothetical protein
MVVFDEESGKTIELPLGVTFGVFRRIDFNCNPPVLRMEGETQPPARRMRHNLPTRLRKRYAEASAAVARLDFAAEAKGAGDPVEDMMSEDDAEG